MREQIIAIGQTSTPVRLSVITPVHRYDASPLLRSMRAAPAGVEFILLDDGSQSAALLSRLADTAYKLAAPVRIIVWEKNRGRAAARNRLVTEARGAYVLMLDADMLPDAPDFLQRWLDVAELQAPHAAFGGLSLRQVSATPATALHYDMFARSDCRSTAERQRSPAQFTASANLMVRRSFLLAHPFDDAFVGWGFEDVEWALRANAHAPVLHVDNPATHAGLDDVEALLRKSAQAGPNFARLAHLHPALVSRFAAYRVAAMLQRLPLPRLFRRISADIARMSLLPAAVRRIALKLFRASHYAEHLA
ncbi:MAG: glycosyltransferase family 2 protein [Hyphomonadaceae bacterium]|nr:glycosyltransferase family 2 protein [Hyphomonadaceae bacterium]